MSFVRVGLADEPVRERRGGPAGGGALRRGAAGVPVPWDFA